ERQEAEQKAQKDRADAEQKQQNCASAQTYLRTLQSGQRIVSSDAAGERVYMEDSQRQQAMERAQRSVSEWCKEHDTAARRLHKLTRRRRPLDNNRAWLTSSKR